MKGNLWEFHQDCNYVHQILLIVNKDKVGNQRSMLNGMEDLTLQVSYLISVNWFHYEGCLKVFQ